MHKGTASLGLVRACPTRSSLAVPGHPIPRAAIKKATKVLVTALPWYFVGSPSAVLSALAQEAVWFRARVQCRPPEAPAAPEGTGVKGQ